jgi:hypothetical protein
MIFEKDKKRLKRSERLRDLSDSDDDHDHEELENHTKSWGEKNEYLLEMWWVPDSLEIYFKTTMPVNNWFGIGFGNKMVDTDLIIWQAFEPTTKTDEQGATVPDVSPTAGEYIGVYGVYMQDIQSQVSQDLKTEWAYD